MLRVLAGGAVAGRAVGAAVGVGGAVVAAEDGVVDVVSYGICQSDVKYIYLSRRYIINIKINLLRNRIHSRK